jgi:reverse gyrase
MAVRNILKCILQNFTISRIVFLIRNVLNISDTNMAAEGKLGVIYSLNVGLLIFIIYNMG